MAPVREQIHPLILNSFSTKEAFLVGEKAAYLGEIAQAHIEGITEPARFVITTELWDAFLAKHRLSEYIKEGLRHCSVSKKQSIESFSRELKKKFLELAFPKDIEKQIIIAYTSLRKTSLHGIAVRPSAVGYPKAELLEDLHFSALSITSEKQFLKAVRTCLASLFSTEAFLYREARGIDQRAVKMSVLVEAMAPTQHCVSGTYRSEGTIQNTAVLEATYGMALYTKKATRPDVFVIFKNTLQEKEAVIKKTIGSKQVKTIESSNLIKEISVPKKDRERFCITDAIAARIARTCIDVERLSHTTVSIEWTFDTKHNQLYILSIEERKNKKQKALTTELFELKRTGDILAKGSATVDNIITGIVHLAHSHKKNNTMNASAVLVIPQHARAERSLIAKARALIVEDEHTHASTIRTAQELGVPCVTVQPGDTASLKHNMQITLQMNAQTGEGIVYKGYLPFEAKQGRRVEPSKTRTKILTHVEHSANASALASLPLDGVSELSIDSIVEHNLRIHPLALVNSHKIHHAPTKKKIQMLMNGYESRTEYAISKIAQSIAEVAAAFYPQSVVLRMSEHVKKYEHLIGGGAFKNLKELSWHGASRYTTKTYKPAFAIECAAIKKVREEWGLANVEILIPYCRTPEEAKTALDALGSHGLVQNEHNLRIHVSCDIPSNLILAEEYTRLFDGLAIGSYSGEDEEDKSQSNPVIRQMIKEVIALAHKHKRKVSLLNATNSQDQEFVEFLVQQGVDGLSVLPNQAVSIRERIAYVEQTAGQTGHRTGGTYLSLVVGCALLGAGLMSLGAGCAGFGEKAPETVSEVTPAEIRQQVTEQVTAQKAEELAKSRAKLHVSGFAAFDMEYPTGWNVEYTENGVTIVDPNNKDEYISIFRQLLSHPVAYTSSTISGVPAQFISATTPGTEVPTSIYILGMQGTTNPLEINARGARAEEAIKTLSIDFSKGMSKTSLTHWDVREKRMCGKMAVFARADEGQSCQLFANPCDVPAGFAMCDSQSQ